MILLSFKDFSQIMIMFYKKLSIHLSMYRKRELTLNFIKGKFELINWIESWYDIHYLKFVIIISDQGCTPAYYVLHFSMIRVTRLPNVIWINVACLSCILETKCPVFLIYEPHKLLINPSYLYKAMGVYTT